MTAALLPLAFAIAGFAVGRLYFAALRRTVDLYAAGGPRLAPFALTIGRIAAVALFLGVAVQVGALPLLAAFAGFLLARGLALGSARGAA